MQIAPGNMSQLDRASQAGLYGAPSEPHVAHVAFSNDGSVMVTVDVRPKIGNLSSEALRFWDRRESSVTLACDRPLYTINTYLDDPHRCSEQHVCIKHLGSALLITSLINKT